MAKRRKRNMECLKYYRLHDQDRPLHYVIYKTFPVLEDLQYYYEYELKKSESIGLFVMEEILERWSFNYLLHDYVNRPAGGHVYMKFPTFAELQYHYEYVMKTSEISDLVIMEEQENDKSNPGRLRKIFCLCRM